MFASARDIPELPNTRPFAGEVVEISLLLPAYQVIALESAAARQGISAGEFMRHLLDDYLRGGLSVPTREATTGES